MTDYNPGGRNDVLRAELWAAQSGQCNGYRRAPHPLPLDEAVIDHVIPVSRGGSHQAANLRVLCVACVVHQGREARTGGRG